MHDASAVWAFPMPEPAEVGAAVKAVAPAAVFLERGAVRGRSWGLTDEPGVANTVLVWKADVITRKP